MKKGFTLIELILVIGILSVLSIGAIAVLNPTAQFQKASDARRKSDLSQLQKTLEIYYDDNGKYPPHFDTTDYRIEGLDGNAVAWGTSWQPYIDVMPKDPSGQKAYVYFASSNGQSYWLYASLDRDTDISACNKGDACNSLSSNGISATACGETCNFGVSSPNVSP
ncbi:MAG: type II secretion system protein GspG [Candidatus Levybacteria bacterium]|nr:type II secretion system protein GspG [Candidatus Levybacteria bacterium]